MPRTPREMHRLCCWMLPKIWTRRLLHASLPPPRHCCPGLGTGARAMSLLLTTTGGWQRDKVRDSNRKGVWRREVQVSRWGIKAEPGAERGRGENGEHWSKRFQPSGHPCCLLPPFPLQLLHLSLPYPVHGLPFHVQWSRRGRDHRRGQEEIIVHAGGGGRRQIWGHVKAFTGCSKLCVQILK